MVRTVTADAAIENYLKKLSKQEGISVGLILGQPSTGGKDHVVHLAKTPVSLPDFDGNNQNSAPAVLETIVDFDNNLLCDHVLSVIRMLPGGFFVLGLFVVCPRVFDDDAALRKIKSMLTNVAQVLKSNSKLFSETTRFDGQEMLLFHYSSTVEDAFACKTMSSDSSKGHTTKSIDWKFQDMASTWQMIETVYEINEIFPFAKKDTEANLMDTLQVIGQRVKDSLVFLDGRPASDDQVLGVLFDGKCGDNSDHLVQSHIYFPCPFTNNETEENKIEKHTGLITYSGTIVSRIWAHAKNKFSDIETAIKEDIVRSLAARIQIFCDVDAESGVDDLVVHEPPRRVFLQLTNRVQLSDYLFRNETFETAIAQAREQLDLDLEKSQVLATVETFTTVLDTKTSVSSETGAELSVKDNSRLYFMGITAAVLVLILSITLHFVMN